METWARQVFGGERGEGDAWVDTSRPPFSFVYGGRPSAELLPTWAVTRSRGRDARGERFAAEWAEPGNGLRVTAAATVPMGFPAVEWTVCFENTGSGDTPILEDVQALDTSLPADASGLVELHRIHGDNCNRDSYVPFDTRLGIGERAAFAPNGGRPSTGAFPFFTIEHAGRALIAAIGWTGQWAASVERGRDRVTLRAGMERTRLLLHPGERIRTPRILLMEHRGPVTEAQNLFRRLMLAHYLPTRDGKPVTMPIACQCFDRYQHRAEWESEEGQIRAAEFDKAIGCDTYWFDAAWFVGGFPNGVGNWDPNPEMLPRGLRPVADACHRLGLSVAVWFEPERVSPGSRIMREHPEFVRFVNPDDYARGEQGLFRLDDPAAREWLTELLAERIEQFGVDVYRNDFNIDPLPFWRAGDAPDRQGMTEIRYVEGLYRMWDDLRARYPHLLIDNCASGGRRIDLETVSRSVSLTRSDTACVAGNQEGNQAQSYGLSLYLPLHATMHWDPSAYTARSGAAAGAVAQYDYLSGALDMAEAGAAIAEIRANQPYWYGDFYPLTGCSVALDSWLAFQLHRPDLDAGILLAFRRPECAELGLHVQPQALRPTARYAVETVDETRRPTLSHASGRDLAAGMRLACAAGASVLVRYRAEGEG